VRDLTSSSETKSVQWIWRMRLRHQLSNASIFFDSVDRGGHRRYLGTVYRNIGRMQTLYSRSLVSSVMEDLQIFCGVKKNHNFQPISRRISETVQVRTKITTRPIMTNRKSHTRFRLVSKSTILDDPGWPLHTVLHKIRVFRSLPKI